MRVLGDPRMAVLFRLAVGVAFVWSGIAKLTDPAAFEEGLVNYRMFPGWMIPLVAATLPTVEVVAGACLIFGLAVRGAALLTSLLLVAMTAAIVQVILRGINVTCGCFGSGSDVATSVGWTEVARDIGLLLATLHVLFYDRGLLSLERLRARAKTSSLDGDEP